MASTSKTIIAFDLYGTLLCTDSIAQELAIYFSHHKSKTIATLWRRYQLEYTWRLNSMSLFSDFLSVTRASLIHALADLSLSLPDPAIASLLHAYNALPTFPDAAAALASIRALDAIDAYVFSNGSRDMVSASVTQSPWLSPFADVFSGLVTVDDVKAYKPDPRAYRHLGVQVGSGERKEDLEGMWLVSANPFDVVGARAAGMSAAWVDRGGLGWVDGLGELVGAGPTVVVAGVDEAVMEIERMAREAGGGGAEKERPGNMHSAATGPGYGGELEPP